VLLRLVSNNNNKGSKTRPTLSFLPDGTRAARMASTTSSSECRATHSPMASMISPSRATRSLPFGRWGRF
jgi:hypothetical protein